MDVLSNLSNDVLCHILSFLTTKEAALTSVLSKRWRNLLAFVPNIDISYLDISPRDDSVFLHPEEGKRYRNEIRQSFVDFVDRVLALQGNSPIKRASLKCENLDSDQVDGWISNLLARGVSELDLLINIYTLLSSKRFESKNLVKLKLGKLCIGCEPGFWIHRNSWLAKGVVLPMLKTLVLESVGFYVDKSFLSALPALEELVMVDVFWLWNGKDVTVSNASLKTLTMNSNQYSATFSFDTPSLGYFCYSDHVAKDYPVVKMENLFEARISLLVTEHQIKRARAPNYDWFGIDGVVLQFSNVGKLMNGIRNVQNLYLSPDTIEVLSLCCESIPVFNNLKSLTIKSNKSRGWQAMPVLLRNCPHLETLVLEGLLHHVTDKCGDACDCVSREEKGRSLTSCSVKELEIKGFQGTMKEMHMIKHFFNYFPCLKELKVFDMEENGPTKHKEVYSEFIAGMIEKYYKSSSCNVHFLVSGYLYKNCTMKPLKNETCA